MRAHHPLIEKVQSLINSKAAHREPEGQVEGRGAAAEAASMPAAVDLRHDETCPQQEAVKAQTESARRSDHEAMAATSPACSTDSTTPNDPESRETSRDTSPTPPGESMLEQLSVVPQWTTDPRPSPSLGGDLEREESCREELKSVIRDLHNYR